MTLYEIANKVDSLVLDTTVRTRFTNHIDQFCKMVEDYGKALQPYAEKLEKAEKQMEKFPVQFEKYKHTEPDGTTRISIVEVCPPPKGWVKMNYFSHRFVNITNMVIHRPPEPENPIFWMRLREGYMGMRKPTEEEKLMCHYVLMAVIHDYELRYSGSSTYTPIFSDKYDGKWFQRDQFIEETWMYYSNFGTLYQGVATTAQDKLSELNLAFNHVQADIASTDRKGGRISNFLWMLYEKTLKAFFDSLFGKWEPK